MTSHIESISTLAHGGIRWKTAEFSEDRIYRYTLWRGPVGPFVQFIGLNPSTADEERDDPTIRKCKKFAKAWGYDAMCMTNIFAYRATDPRDMKKAADPIGSENMRWISRVAERASLIVAVWSQHGTHLEQGNRVRGLLVGYPIHVLKLGKAGPYHPLYLPDVTKPFLWR